MLGNSDLRRGNRRAPPDCQVTVVASLVGGLVAHLRQHERSRFLDAHPIVLS
jgi:hypothetical protein